MSVWVLKSRRTCVLKRSYLESFTCSCKNGRYAGSFIDNSVIMHEITEETKNVLTNFNKKR